MRNCINIKCYVPSAPRPRDDYIWLSHWLQAGNNARPYMPLAPDTTLEPGEVYNLVPDLAGLLGNPLVPSKIVRQEGCKRKKIKIVVTREQLELLKSATKLRSREDGVRLSGRFRLEPPKWQPSLAIVLLNDGILDFYLSLQRHLYIFKNSRTDYSVLYIMGIHRLESSINLKIQHPCIITSE
ncbi:hypothetical protein ACFX2I_037063 [Malus domestica]